MPYMTNGKRDYKKEGKWEKTTPSGKQHAEDRKTRRVARDRAEAEGVVKNNDGKHIDHKTPLSKGGSNSKSNLRVTSAASNTSFARNRDGSLKSQISKRERRK